MKCPICLVDLLVADRQGIEVDFCPTCRGVWLDRGELDKLISRGAVEARSAHERDRYDDDSDVDYPDPFPLRKGSYESQHRKRRGSFLRELFDFG